jgi:hypothetical protein
MQQLLDSTCFFTWTFQKRGSIAPGHVGTLFFPANEKLRGIEHAQLKKGSVKAILSTFWARPIRDMVRRGLKKENLKQLHCCTCTCGSGANFGKILKEQCILFVCAIIFYLLYLKLVFFGYYF